MARYWGYESFRPLQQEAMECALSAQDSMVILPTGGGKSLCFQVPALCLEGLTVVVSPLISLMKDQVDALRECGVEAAQLNSSMSAAEKRDIDRAITDEKLKLLYVAPERLATDAMLNYLKRFKIAMIAIDEAHCISAWGHDFRPEYRMLGTLKDHFPNVGIHAYTATASVKVREDIAQQLRLENPRLLVGSFDRPNLTYRVVPAKNRFGQICDFVQSRSGESGVVYCISRKEVDKVAMGLNGLGIRAVPYHAGLSDQERRANQEAFLQDRCDVIVATVAFGMGIDKPDVRFVLHASAPKSLEHYQQESGRAGRDGLEADCTLIYSPGDMVVWSRMLESSSNGDALQGQLRSLDTIRNYCTGTLCRHRSLVQYFGQDLQSEHCGACDVCLEEIELVEDPLRISQMVLSCVVRLNQRYGVDYTAKVLIGSKESRIEELKHSSLSTYGLLQEYAIGTVKAWIDQLISQGYMVRSQDNYATLSLTPSGRLLLKGSAQPKLTRPDEAATSTTPRKSKAASDDWEGVDRGLFECLKAVRSRVASERSVPAFVIFGDATLREIARRRPSSLQTFSTISGVGAKKLEDLGQVFLDATTAYCTDKNLTTDVELQSPASNGKSASARPTNKPTGPIAASIGCFPLWTRGASIEEVCSSTQRARSTVMGYLNDYLQHAQVVDASPWVSAEEIVEIEKAIEATGVTDRLRPLFDHTEGKIHYDSLRVVLSCYRNRQVQTTTNSQNCADAKSIG